MEIDSPLTADVPASTRSQHHPRSTPPTRRVYFGEFEVLGVIGRGGMAAVALARSPREFGLPDLVAVKFLNQEHLRDPDALDAFEQEARLGTLLRHPCLCRTYGIHRVGRRAAILLEHVPGYTLSRAHRALTSLGTPDEQSLAVSRIGLCIAAALQAIHEAKDPRGTSLEAVHRDVSPQNIILTPDGGVKLIDFGVMFSANRHLKTRKGVVKGKLAYMAPEYLLGKNWNHQADIWSLGVLLWEMIADKRLFPSTDSAQFMRAVQGAPIPALTKRCPHVAPEISRVVERALKRDLDERYPDARTMASDLLGYLNRMGDDHGQEVLSRLLGRLVHLERAPHAQDEITIQQPNASKSFHPTGAERK